MRRWMLGTLMALAAPAVIHAAPICVAGSLTDYIALGPGGCMVGNALFTDFDASNPLFTATDIPEGSIGVSPIMSATSVALDFSLAFARRQDVYTLDVYAWALYANSAYREAREQISRVLAVGTRDPALVARAKIISAHSRD